jgi:hypothetical protein
MEYYIVQVYSLRVVLIEEESICLYEPGIKTKPENSHSARRKSLGCGP